MAGNLSKSLDSMLEQNSWSLIVTIGSQKLPDDVKLEIKKF